MNTCLCLLFLIVGSVAQIYGGSNVDPNSIKTNVNNAKGNIEANIYGDTSLNEKVNDGVILRDSGGGIYSDLGGYGGNRNIGYLLDTMYKDGNPFYNKIDGNDQDKVDGNNATFEVDAGNPDINAKIQRPCEVYDTFCIRRFFASHSRCRISEGPVQDPLYRAQLTLNYPRVNMSATQTNIEYRGLNNARVEEFYINTATNNVVVTLEFDNIDLFSNNTYLKFYQRGREPIITRDFGGLNYGKISVTAVIPHINDLRLDKAEMHSFLSNPVFSFVVGPGLLTSTDPAVAIMFAAFLENPRNNLQEALLTEGNYYAATYIQTSICDFGLKVL